MAAIPLGITAFKRDNARSPEMRLINRYYESNPWNQTEQVGLIIRPALRKRGNNVGEGPIRRMMYQPGCFANDMFVVSGFAFFRVKKSILVNVPDAITQIAGSVDGSPSRTPDMVITPTHVFVADGSNLLVSNGVTALAPVAIPDNKSVVSIDYIAGYVMLVLGNSDRFYWIDPGAIIIDPLDFATAERLPDFVLNVRTVGDQFWLLGEKTTEVWYPTGDGLAPFQRAQGRIFDRGIWGGTAVKVGDSVIVAADDGTIMQIDAGPETISTPGIAERVRKAMKKQGIN